MEPTVVAPTQVNQPDKVCMDVPLLIRLLEYAREEAGADKPLHEVAERAVQAMQGTECLSMANYDSIVPPVQPAPVPVAAPVQEPPAALPQVTITAEEKELQQLWLKRVKQLAGI